MKRKPEKHMPYYTVLEAFQKAKGCALCELEAATTHRYLDFLLYESVNDSGTREDLLHSRGYARLKVGVRATWGLDGVLCRHTGSGGRSHKRSGCRDNRTGGFQRF